MIGIHFFCTGCTTLEHSLEFNSLRADVDRDLQQRLNDWLKLAYPHRAKSLFVLTQEETAFLYGNSDDQLETQKIVQTLGLFPGVLIVENRVQVSLEEPQPQKKAETGSLSPTRHKKYLFPREEIFLPFLAAPKQPRFHATWQRWKTDQGSTDIGSVGFGENIGLIRGEKGPKDFAWQLGIDAAVFSTFNLDTPSFDLQNSDFIVGFPLDFRQDIWSLRVRTYHQSSHLGDEFLLNLPPGTTLITENFSYEAVEFLASAELGHFRVYGGPSRIFHSANSLQRAIWQGGAEFRSDLLGSGTARLIAGIDFHSWEETDWDTDVSIKAGVMLPSPYFKERSVQFLIEYYKGHTPNGQFFDSDIEYVGLGVTFLF